MMYVSRADWGAVGPKQQPTHLSSQQQRGVAVHHSGAKGERKQDHRDCAGVVRAIQRFHQEARGWNDVAYNWLTCAHGYLFEGRGTGIRSAAQGTNEGNADWHAVCFLGSGEVWEAGLHLETPLHAAIALTRSWAPSAYRVWPHLRFHSTTCPGRDLRQWCRQFPD